MKIQQKRVIKIKRYLVDFRDDEYLCVGIKLDEEAHQILKKKMNVKQSELEEGYAFFPAPYYGPMTKRNAIGEFIPQKDQDMVTDYRIQEVYWKDWGGHEHSTSVLIPYKRYPRKKIEPKEFNLIYRTLSNEEFLVIDQVFQNNESFYQNIKFAVNLLLELFGQAELLRWDKEGGNFSQVEIKKKNWEFLPPGERINEVQYCWWKNNTSRSGQKYLKERLAFLDTLKPREKYRGLGGFSNYIAYCFPHKDLFILDSVAYGNATYIFSNDWEEVSKLTKKEIITQDLHLHRVYHDLSWKQNITAIFSSHVSKNE